MKTLAVMLLVLTISTLAKDKPRDGMEPTGAACYALATKLANTLKASMKNPDTFTLLKSL